MRLLPKRLSMHIQLTTVNANDVDFCTPSRKQKKPPKKQARYRAVDSGSEISFDEAITPRSTHSSTSPTINEFHLDFTDARSGNFVRTMHIISKESRRRSAVVTSGQDLLNLGSSYDSTSDDDSLYDSPSDHKAKERAVYIASRLKREFGTIFEGCQLYPPPDFEMAAINEVPEVSMIDMTKMIADRLYTYAYLTAPTTKSLPSRNPFSNRALGRDFLSRPAIVDKAALVRKLELNLSRQGDASLAQKPGGHEAFYAFRYTLDHFFKHRILPSQKTIMVERARQVIEKCKENEAKLSSSERACMYSFQRLMSGIDWDKGMEPQLYGLED